MTILGPIDVMDSTTFLFFFLARHSLAPLWLCLSLKSTFTDPSLHPTNIWLIFGCHIHFTTLCEVKNSNIYEIPCCMAHSNSQLQVQLFCKLQSDYLCHKITKIQSHSTIQNGNKWSTNKTACNITASFFTDVPAMIIFSLGLNAQSPLKETRKESRSE